MKLSQQALDSRIEHVSKVPGKGSWTTVRCVQVFTLGRQLQIDVGELVVDVAGKRSIGKSRTVGRQTGPVVKVLNLFSATSSYELITWLLITV